MYEHIEDKAIESAGNDRQLPATDEHWKEIEEMNRQFIFHEKREIRFSTRIEEKYKLNYRESL